MSAAAYGYSVIARYSLFLIFGAVAALVWANLSPHSYHALVEFQLFGDTLPQWTVHSLVLEVLMALFFFGAAKEIFESFLPGGDLHSPRTAALPLVATLGGMIGPALVYVALAITLGATHLLRGWAIPCATDIAFSYLVARLVFGEGHPAIKFLLLLAVADDAGGLLILATCYPTGNTNLLLFSVLVSAGIASGYVLRNCGVKFWPAYVFGAGGISWLGFYLGGIEPALGLVPIVMTMPHEKYDLGVFANREDTEKDVLNRAEHALKPFVQLILGLFGLVSVGVPISNLGIATLLVGCGLLIGKPLGITGFSWLGIKLGLRLPSGMTMRETIVLGVAASLGFTVALFVSSVAFRHGTAGITSADLDAAKMGSLLSFVGALFTFIVARALGVKPRTTGNATVVVLSPAPVAEVA